MQVALPRTQDAGRLQGQVSRQNQHFQHSLAEQQLIEEKRKQQRVTTFEDVDRVQVDKEREDSALDDENKDNDKHQETEKNNQTKHPYLGANIDFSR